MPLDYVVVALAAIGAAMTAAPAVFGHWRRPDLRRWALAAATVTLLIGIAAVVGWLGSGLATPVAYTMIAACVALSALGMILVAKDERTPDAARADEPVEAVTSDRTTDSGTNDSEVAPEPTDAEFDLTQEALLFSTTTRHGWGAELAELLAEDADDAPARPPRRGA